MTSYRLAGRSNSSQNTIIDIPAPAGTIRLGQGYFTILVNLPAFCLNEEGMVSLKLLKEAGAGMAALNMAETSREQGGGLPADSYVTALETVKGAGLAVAAGIVDYSQLDVLYPLADAFQVDSRHMQNYSLLEALGGVDRPVILERSYAATVEEWILAAEYVMNGGNNKVILCESGIRTFESLTRRTLDVSAIALAKLCSHLPVFAYPGHATGQGELILPLSRAAIAAGADGISVDVRPMTASQSRTGLSATGLSGIDQSAKPGFSSRVTGLEELADKLKALAAFVGRETAVYLD